MTTHDEKEREMERKRKQKEINQDRRRQAALERLGTNSPRCVFCGENDPHCLEKHHIAGIAYDAFTAIHCRNCHRKQSNRQHDHPQKSETNPSFEETVGRFLLGLADFLVLLIEKLREFGETLISGPPSQGPSAGASK